MKINLLVLTVSILMTSLAHAAAPTNCIGSKDPDQAYLSNVEATLVSNGYRAVPRYEIEQTSTENHNPEYDVIVANGKKVHVTCDDSGDDQCFCSIAN